MKDIFTVRFTVTRSAMGGHFAECPYLGAPVNVSTLAALETGLIEFAASLLDETPTSLPPCIVVRKSFPAGRARRSRSRFGHSEVVPLPYRVPFGGL
jgi:hypothetical protein